MGTRQRVAALAAGLLLMSSVPMLSHHSQSMYDMTKEVSVKGVVTRFEWANPHSWVYVEGVEVPGKPDAGKAEAWEFETVSTNSLTRAGWKRTQLKAGDQITAVGNPHKGGKKAAHLVRVILPDGKVLLPGRDPNDPMPAPTPGAAPR